MEEIEYEPQELINTKEKSKNQKIRKRTKKIKKERKPIQFC